MQADVVPGRTAAEIAERHGLTTKAYTRALAEGKIQRTDDTQLIQRDCLGCRKMFFTDSPFVRRCSTCKDKCAAADEYLLGSLR